MSYDNYDPSELDPYCIPGSTCLSNKLGFTDTQALNEAEAEISSIAMAELEINPLFGTYDLTHLKAIHSYLFNDVYQWAGVERQTEISKGGQLFLPYKEIPGKAAEIFSEFHAEANLVGLPKSEFVERAGYYFGIINCIHPFREGNGRVQRILFNQLATDAGFAIQWSAISSEAMANACRKGRTTTPDYRDLIKLFRLNTIEPDSMPD